MIEGCDWRTERNGNQDLGEERCRIEKNGFSLPIQRSRDSNYITNTKVLKELKITLDIEKIKVQKSN